ncbi:MAG: YajQ family cyclic di-GMP-binding protein [Gammaproteobacteria bacterium]|nr:YajQ family cyclic di-GMP-binding protein [Gammaproteobacteria bacterium]MCP5459286.1 YajQ family cyclic di-GMP-binding protein [Gammaproteobacteria bacterium]
MPSFDVVSEVNAHELNNAVDQANREITARYDFKGSDARVDQTDFTLSLVADSEFQIQQMTDILYQKLAKRGIDLGCLKADDMEVSGKKTRQTITVRQGIDTDLGRDIVKRVKNSKLKVQAAIQGDQVRVTGKKRDDLQAAIALLKEANLGLPLQYINFRD